MISNNINDLIQAARDGEVGVIDQIKIGDLIVSALFGLDAPETLRTTSRKIQNGMDLTTAAVEEDRVISMDICLANPDLSVDAVLTAALTGTMEQATDTWRDKVKQLRKIKDDREIVTVQTHDEIITSCIVTGIYPVYDVDNNWDAFISTVTLEKKSFYGYEDPEESNALIAELENVGAL